MADTTLTNPTSSHTTSRTTRLTDHAVMTSRSASSEPPADQGERQPTRRRLHPAQRQLLFASFGVIVGSFLPWVTTTMGLSYSGFAGAGLYTFYLGVFGVAGGLVPRPRLAALQGGIVAVSAVGLPLWQLLHLIARVGVGGWLPGAGLVVVLASGLLAGLSSWQLLRA